MDMNRLAPLALALALALVACSPAPASIDETPPTLAPIEIQPADEALRDAIAWSLEWWHDAGETRELAIVDACSERADTVCVPAIWRGVTSAKAGQAFTGGEYLFESTTIEVAPIDQTLPGSWLHAVVAHEIGHAIGYVHAPADEIENLMAPKPDIAGGTLCIENPEALCREL